MQPFSNEIIYTTECYNYETFQNYLKKLKRLTRSVRRRKNRVRITTNVVKLKTKNFVLLKSPHVNKKSQEKFRQSTYRISFNIVCTEMEILYKISNLLFLISSFQSTMKISQKIKKNLKLGQLVK